ncbi:MAG: hypothetical protein V1717_02505 [Candidatus Micrarchaeota archaeon]
MKRLQAQYTNEGINPLTSIEHALSGSGHYENPGGKAALEHRSRLGEYFIAHSHHFELPEEIKNHLIDLDTDGFVLVRLPPLEKALEQPDREDYCLVDERGNPVLDDEGKQILVMREKWLEILDKTKKRE